MRYYEVFYIVDPQLEDTDLQEVVDRFSTLVNNNGGEVLNLERWDRRRLAYQIGAHRDGQYILMHFRGEPTAEAELKRVFGITDSILRFLILRLDERKAAEFIEQARLEAEKREADRQAAAARAAEAAATAEAEAAARAEAEAARRAEEEPDAETVDEDEFEVPAADDDSAEGDEAADGQPALDEAAPDEAGDEEPPSGASAEAADDEEEQAPSGAV